MKFNKEGGGRLNCWFPLPSDFKNNLLLTTGCNISFILIPRKHACNLPLPPGWHQTWTTFSLIKSCCDTSFSLPTFTSSSHRVFLLLLRFFAWGGQGSFLNPLLNLLKFRVIINYSTMYITPQFSHIVFPTLTLGEMSKCYFPKLSSGWLWLQKLFLDW